MVKVWGGLCLAVKSEMMIVSVDFIQVKHGVIMTLHWINAV